MPTSLVPMDRIAPSEGLIGDDTSDTAFDGASTDNQDCDGNTEVQGILRETTSEEKEEGDGDYEEDGDNESETDDDEEDESDDGDGDYDDEGGSDENVHEGSEIRRVGSSSKLLNINDLRLQLWEKMKKCAHENRREEDIIRECQQNDGLTQACYKSHGRFPTVLHWASNYLMTNHPSPNEMILKPFKYLQTVALSINQALLKVQTKLGETPLHMAVENSQEELVRHMCQWADEGTMTHVMVDTGETCLHMAIRHDMPCAQDLASVASQKALQMPTRKVSGDKSDEAFPKGNTPLHDALHFKFFQAKSPNCTQNPLCNRCSTAREANVERRNRMLRLIKTLVERYPNALTMRNADGESPYLFLLSTHKALRPASQTGGGNGATCDDEKPSSSNFPANGARGIVHTDAGIRGQSPKPLGRNYASKERSSEAIEPRRTRKDPSHSGKNTKLKRKGKKKDGVKKRQNCEKLEDDDSIFKDVEIYIREASFGLGSFEMACKCFFGSETCKLFWRTQGIQ